jgi:hypothetical protein
MVEIIYREDAQQLDLPKWPQLTIVGQPVTEEQAKDIIFRTDDFLHDVNEFSGGNDREWDEWARQTLGLQRFLEACKIEVADGDHLPTNWWLYDMYESMIKLQDGAISSGYVYNRWASSCFIYGPAGWCNPDGAISFGYNVGKWPEIEEIAKDFSAILNAFPYVKLSATVYSDEHSTEGSEPVAYFVVGNGEVIVTKDIFEVPDYGQPRDTVSIREAARRIGTYHFEHGLSDSWIEDWGTLSKEAYDHIFDLVMYHKEQNRLTELRDKITQLRGSGVIQFDWRTFNQTA